MSQTTKKPTISPAVQYMLLGRDMSIKGRRIFDEIIREWEERELQNGADTHPGASYNAKDGD